MKHLNQNKKGFNLVELMVVIAIIGIMTSVVFVVIDTSEKDVDIATQLIVAQLRELQNDALNGKKVKNSGGVLENACSFKWTAESSSSYKISYYKQCSLIPEDTSLIIALNPVSLKKVTVTSSSSNIVFQSPYAKNAGATIKITSTKNTAVSKTITIRNLGSIETN